MNQILRSLNSRNYRLFYVGQGISLVGTWMQRIAVSWLVYRLTNSAFLLGVVSFTGQLPSFIFAPFAGVWVDRSNKRRLLIWTQVFAMLQAVLLAALVLLKTVTWWQVMILSMVLGLVNAFDVPARQSFVIEMIEKREDLGNAIALNSSLVNIARLIGQSLAGLLIAIVGEGVCFVLNAVSYMASIAALVLMRVSTATPKQRNGQVWSDLKEGFKYAYGFAPLRAILLLLSLVSVMGMPYQVLMPIFAKDILHSDSKSLGFLMGAAGAGALLGAIYLASRLNLHRILKTIAVAPMIFGVGLILFSHSRWMFLSLPMLFIAGLGMMVSLAASNTTIQTIVADNKRGRVMAIYTMAFMGMAPFGSLLAGWLAGAIGAPNTILFGGLTCILGGLLFWNRLPSYSTQLRPLLVKN